MSNLMINGSNKP